MKKRNGVKLSAKSSLILTVLITLALAITGIVILVRANTDVKVIMAKQELSRAMEYEQVQDGDERTNNECVNFDAFFLKDLDKDGFAEKIRGTCKAIGEADTLYFSLNVMTDGMLKNGRIQILGENMYFQTALIDDETIKGNYVSPNTSIISLKDVSVGTQKLIFGSVRSGNYNERYQHAKAIGNDITKYSKINKVKLTGTHVASDGTETLIEKVVDLTVDWHEIPNAEIPFKYAKTINNKAQNYNSSNVVDAINQTVNFSFRIVVQETDYLQNLATVHVEGRMPKFNGFAPTNVEFVGNDVEFVYEPESRFYMAEKKATVTESGTVIKQAYTGQYEEQRYTVFNVVVTYPLEAYETIGINTINLNVPVKAYYEAYNNPNDEFTNPVRSNIVEDIISVTYERGGGDTIGFDVRVGNYVPGPYDAWVVSKEKPEVMYNGYEASEEPDLYNVIWTVARGADGTISNLMLKDNNENYGDKLVTSSDEYISTEGIVKNKGIYFLGASNMFGEDGWIRVYDDETNKLLKEFKEEDWNTYTQDNPYYYEELVSHIRLETSEARTNTAFVVYNIKEINDSLLTQTFTREQFDSLKLIFSYLTGYVKIDGATEYRAVKNDQEKANYDSILSIVEINGITPDYFSTQETKENVKIEFSTKKMSYNTTGWKNGEFLLKFPEEVLALEVNDVTINNPAVTVLGYSLDEAEGGYELRILTENTTPEVYTITVDCNLTPDPRELTSSKHIVLYARNDMGGKYRNSTADIYDVNLDENKDEIIGKAEKYIQFVGPTSIITMESAREYNDLGEITIAPQIAVIDKADGEQTAKVVAGIRNNYSGNISGLKVLGNIPYEGNTFMLNGKALGSTFTTTLVGPIQIPADFESFAKVYYSENTNVTEDIEDVSNEWKLAEGVTDFSLIKAYLIDLGDYYMQKGEEREFTYQVKLPSGLNYNEITYSTHAIHFYLETEEGKLRDRTETNKLGLMIAKKFNLQIEKQKENSDVVLKGAIYKITEEGGKNSKILVTNSKGILNFKNLYVDRTYIVEELRAPENYEKSLEILKIKGRVDEAGELVVDVLEGKYESKTRIVEENTTIEKFVLENKPKIVLNIHKKDENQNILENIRFNLVGKGSESGKTIITNSQGIGIADGLYEGEVYTLTEVRAEGYYLPENSISFKVNKTNGNYSLEIISDENVNGTKLEFTNSYFTENESFLPVMNVDVVNEEIPTFTLEVTKVDNTDETRTLSNAQFVLNKIDLNEEKYFLTGEDGKLTVTGLYQYVEGRPVVGEYKLKEVAAPEGYITDDKEYHFKVVNDNDVLNVEFLNENEFEYTLENNVLKVKISNSPIFNLVKKDGKTGEVLPNTKFAIWKIDEQYNEYTAYDINGNVVGEEKEIDGIVYRVITTNEEGRISISLPKGMYKLVEIETSEKYYLPENVDERTYYFGIGETVPGTKEWGYELYHVIEKEYGIKSEQVQFTYARDTNDGGYIKVGVLLEGLIIPEDQTADGKEIVVVNNYRDTIICKFNKDDKVEWVRTLSSSQYKTIQDINVSADGQVIICLYIPNTKLDIYENGVKVNELNVIENEVSSSINYLIYKYNPNTKEDMHKEIHSEGMAYSMSTEATSNGNFIFTCQIMENECNLIKIHNDKTGEDVIVKGNGSRDQGVVIFDKDMDPIWTFNISAAGNNWTDDIIKTPDDGFLVMGTIWHPIIVPADKSTTLEDVEIRANGGYDPIILKFNKDGKLENYKVIGGPSRDYGESLVCTEDGYLFSGRSNSASITVKAEDTVKNEEIVKNNINGYGTYVGYMCKLTLDLQVEWMEMFDEQFSTIYSNSKGEPMIFMFKPDTIRAELTANNKEIPIDAEEYYILATLNDVGKIVSVLPSPTTGIMFERNGEYFVRDYVFHEKNIDPEVPKMQEIVVENDKVSYKVLTDAEDGGTISGDGVKPYFEKVSINEDSKKDIVVTPSEGHIIQSIKVDGEDIEFTPREDGSFTLNKFKNVTKDINVQATFSANNNLLTIKKVDENNNSITGQEFEVSKYFEDERTITLADFGEPLPYDNYYRMSVENETQLVSDITMPKGTAASNYEMDFKGFEDLYEVTITASINSTEDATDYGYIYLYGADKYVDAYKKITTDAKTTPEQFTFEVKGGEQYYMTFWYYKQSEYEESQITFDFDIQRKQETWNVPINGNGYGYQNLPIGRYDVKEIKAADGYILSDEVKTVEFNDDIQNVELTFVNRKEVHPTVVIKHLVQGTEERIISDTVINGIVGEMYRTEPVIDIAGYELIKNKDYYSQEELLDKDLNGDDVYIPENAIGTINDGIQEVIYLYKKKPVKLTVNHFIHGTEEPVSEENFETELPKGSEYTTESATDIEEKYELVETPANANGTIKEDTVVNYYYKVKTFDVTTKVEKHIETNKLGIETEIAGGSILGETDRVYETVEHGEDSTKEIVATPDEGYYVETLTVNDEDVDFIPDYNGVVKLNKFVNMKENKDVVVGFARDEGKVIVHHYLEGTTQKVPSVIEGEVIEDEIKQGDIGAPFATKPSTEIALRYGVVSNTEPTSGTYTEEDQFVTYYYNLKDFEYRVEYYYNDVLDEIKTEVLSAKWGTTVDNYPDKIADGYNFDRVENLPLTISEVVENNVIKVYYEPKDVSMVIKYVDKHTDEEIAEPKVIYGKAFDKHDLAQDIIEIDGYTLFETPDPMVIELNEQTKEYIIYYAANTKVTVNHKDKNTDEVFETITIEGKVGDSYETYAKNYDGYRLDTIPENSMGTMTKEEIIVDYYYVHESKGVVEKHIDINTDKLLDSSYYIGEEGDPYSTDKKEFIDYEIISNKDYYTVFIKEQFTDEEILDLLKEYDVETEDELFEIYTEELVLEILKDKELASDAEYIPANKEGTMSKEVIEVEYYYAKVAKVKVEYIDKQTGKPIIVEEGIDEDGDGVVDNIKTHEAIEIIEGHVGEKYETTAKEFDGYILVKDEDGNVIIPENAKGEMTEKEIVVTYEYVKAAKVIERHIDSITNELIEPETIHDGYLGKEYDISKKVFDKYTLITDKLPTNSKGEMTEEDIIVEYYYIHNARVTVEYIDKITGEMLDEKVNIDVDGDGEYDRTDKKDSIVIFKGYEGDSYKAERKEFDGYTLVDDMLPQNEEGKMTKEEIFVKYYYVHESAGVREEHRDALTNELLEEPLIHSGHEGDSYKIDSKVFNNYDVNIERRPNNSEGTMTKEQITVTYYYSRKAEVIVKYIDEETGEEITSEMVIQGHEGKNYSTQERVIDGYALTKYTTNKDGVMDKNVIVVTYYYAKAKAPQEQPKEDADHVVIGNTVTVNNQVVNTVTNTVITANTVTNTTNTANTIVSNTVKNEDYNKDEEVETPKTGDNTPIIVMIGCMLVVLANSLQIVLSANKKPKVKPKKIIIIGKDKKK